VINIKQVSSSFVAKDNKMNSHFAGKGQNCIEMDVKKINFLFKWTGFRLIQKNILSCAGGQFSTKWGPRN
jgi:hypothetical protein